MASEENKKLVMLRQGSQTQGVAGQTTPIASVYKGHTDNTIFSKWLFATPVFNNFQSNDSIFIWSKDS